MNFQRAVDLVGKALGLRFALQHRDTRADHNYALVFLSWLDCFNCSEQVIKTNRNLLDLMKIVIPDVPTNAKEDHPRLNPANYKGRKYVGP